MKKRKVNREREERKESIMENEEKAVGMSQNVCVKEASVRNRKLEAEKASQNQEPREQVRRSRRENKGRMQPPKTAPLSPL